MKLFAGVLCALAGVNEAAVQCDAANPTRGLFEARCDHTGITITVNENCRAAHFAGIDFPNSFIWGDSTVTKMADATTNNAIAVVSGSTATCVPKPVATDIVDDAAVPYEIYDNLGYSATTKSWQWSMASLTDCGVTKQTVTAADANGVKYDYYDVFFNSASQTATNNVQIAQMGQIKFTCKLYPWQEDNGIVDITEDAMVDDAAFKLRLWDKLQLKIKYVDAEDTPTVAAMAGMAAAGVQDIAVANRLPAYADYAAGTDVKLGSHMALVLDEITAGDMATIEGVFDLTLNKCWASSKESTTTAGTGDANTEYDVTVNPAKEMDDTYTTADADTTNFVFKLWDEFCPAHAWVSPEPKNGAVAGSTPAVGSYLHEMWDYSATSIKEIHFRQFAFNTDATAQTDFAASTKSKVFYHCLVKVCEKATPPTCSTLQMDATTATTCVAPASFVPVRKRRSELNTSSVNQDLVDAAQLDTEVVVDMSGANCHNHVCVAGQGNSATESSATCAAATTGMALFAALNL